MKCSVFIATIACVLSVTMADSSHKVTEAHSEVIKHVDEKMVDIHVVPASPAHMNCYNSFVPHIEQFAQKAKDDSQICVNKSTADKESKVKGLEDVRLAVDKEIQKIQSSFSDCNTKSGLDFFICIVRTTETNKQLLAAIKEESDNLVINFTTAQQQIDKDEKTCLRSAVDTAKNATDTEFKNLRSCLNLEYLRS